MAFDEKCWFGREFDADASTMAHGSEDAVFVARGGVTGRRVGCHAIYKRAVVVLRFGGLEVGKLLYERSLGVRRRERIWRRETT